MKVGKLLPYLVTMIALAFISTACQASDDYVPQSIAKSERCPVCGMYPAQFPKWHAQIVFKDGEHTSFDSAAELFRFLDKMTKYDKRHAASDIGKIFVPAYEKGTWLDARQAFFVAGSKINGPMGNDLPAFASKEEASRFARNAGGKTLSFDQIAPAVIDDSAHMHSH